MIKAMHYLTAGLIILGFSLNIPLLYNISAGIMLGFALGSWIEYKYESEEKKAYIKYLEELSKRHLIIRKYDLNIPDGESCREK